MDIEDTQRCLEMQLIVERRHDLMCEYEAQLPSRKSRVNTYKSMYLYISERYRDLYITKEQKTKSEKENNHDN